MRMALIAGLKAQVAQSWTVDWAMLLFWSKSGSDASGQVVGASQGTSGGPQCGVLLRG